MFNFNHLYYFYVTAKSVSVTAAAKILQIAQPSLSAQIKVFESSLGRKLFRKKGRRLELTDHGQLVFGHCQKMFGIAADLSHAIRNEGSNDLAKINIGVAEEIERPFVVELVSKMLKSRAIPSTPAITMHSDRHPLLLEQLRSGVLDVIITNQPAFDDDFQVLNTRKMPVVLAFPKKHAVLNHKSKNIKSVVGSLSKNWVMPSAKQRLRLETESFLEKSQMSARVIFESDVLASIVRAIADGVGIGFLPLPYIAKEVALKQIGFYGPSNGFWQHTIWLISRKIDEHDSILKEIQSLFHSTGTS